MPDRPDALTDWLATLPPAWLRDCDPGVIAAARDAYDAPPRHYHTWDHAVACVELLKSVAVANARPVFLALVFHDAVYVAGRADNEERSAALAAEVLDARCRLPADEREAITRMILATRSHHALGPRLSADERAMLDIDLAVLGLPPREYDRYVAAVEREYVPAVVPAAAFRLWRGRFLEDLLARPRLFLTDAAEERWGAAARANVSRELSALRERRGWGARLAGALLSVFRKPPAR